MTIDELIKETLSNPDYDDFTCQHNSKYRGLFRRDRIKSAHGIDCEIHQYGDGYQRTYFFDGSRKITRAKAAHRLQKQS